MKILLSCLGLRRFKLSLAFSLALFSFGSARGHVTSPVSSSAAGRLSSDCWNDLRAGDVVFIHVVGPLSSQIARASNTWVSHVGIIVGQKNGHWLVGEGRVPLSGVTTLDSFLGRSVKGQYAIKRFTTPLTPEQVVKLNTAVHDRRGRIYDFGFNLDARHSTYCSKFVYEVVRESSGQELGEVESFRTLLAQNPSVPLWFWKTWYFGHIPWNRRTITPQSQFRSPLLVTVRAST